MTPFERWSVWVTSVVTTVTGLVYVWMKYALHTTDPWSVVNHPLQPLVLKLHIVTAPLLVFMVGVIALRHVWKHFLNGSRWGRRTGIGVALMTAPMIVTGYVIQVLTDEGLVRAMAWSHIAFGTVYAVGLVLHQVMIRRGAPNGNGRATAAERSRAAARPDQALRS